jgi:hypothetical protein
LLEVSNLRRKGAGSAQKNGWRQKMPLSRQEPRPRISGQKIPFRQPIFPPEKRIRANLAGQMGK